jgi:preprotein translocase subunit SecY
MRDVGAAHGGSHMRALWKSLLNEEGISLKRRWLYTALLLLAFRLLAHVPVANVDEEKLHRLLADNPLVGVVDLFAGGDVLANFSVVAAGSPHPRIPEKAWRKAA